MMISTRLFLNFKIFFTFCNHSGQTLSSLIFQLHSLQTLCMYLREMELDRLQEKLMRDFFCQQFVIKWTIFMRKVSLKRFGPSQTLNSLMIHHYGASLASLSRRKTLHLFLSRMIDGQQLSFLQTVDVNTSFRASSQTSQTPCSIEIKSISSKFTMASWRPTLWTVLWDSKQQSSILRLSMETLSFAEMINSRRLSRFTPRQWMHSNRKISKADINTSEKEARRAAEVSHTLLIIQSI